MIDATQYAVLARHLAPLGSQLSDAEIATLRGAADALVFDDVAAEDRLARAEQLLARIEAAGRVACETVDRLHEALRGINPAMPLPC